MASATNYYFNKSRIALSIRGDDDQTYYLPPRNHTFIKVALKPNYYTNITNPFPVDVVVYPLPNWWSVAMWPRVKPWDPQPQAPSRPYPQV